MKDKENIRLNKDWKNQNLNRGHQRQLPISSEITFKDKSNAINKFSQPINCQNLSHEFDSKKQIEPSSKLLLNQKQYFNFSNDINLNNNYIKCENCLEGNSKDEMLYCLSCRSFIHRNCYCLSEEQYNLITIVKQSQDEFKFTIIKCESCREKELNLSSNIQCYVCFRNIGIMKAFHFDTRKVVSIKSDINQESFLYLDKQIPVYLPTKKEIKEYNIQNIFAHTLCINSCSFFSVFQHKLLLILDEFEFVKKLICNKFGKCTNCFQSQGFMLNNENNYKYYYFYLIHQIDKTNNQDRENQEYYHPFCAAQKQMIQFKESLQMHNQNSNSIINQLENQKINNTQTNNDLKGKNHYSYITLQQIGQGLFGGQENVSSHMNMLQKNKKNESDWLDTLTQRYELEVSKIHSNYDQFNKNEINSQQKFNNFGISNYNCIKNQTNKQLEINKKQNKNQCYISDNFQEHINQNKINQLNISSINYNNYQKSNFNNENLNSKKVSNEAADKSNFNNVNDLFFCNQTQKILTKAEIDETKKMFQQFQSKDINKINKNQIEKSANNINNEIINISSDESDSEKNNNQLDAIAQNKNIDIINDCQFKQSPQNSPIKNKFQIPNLDCMIENDLKISSSLSIIEDNMINKFPQIQVLELQSTENETQIEQNINDNKDTNITTDQSLKQQSTSQLDLIPNELSQTDCIQLINSRELNQQNSFDLQKDDKLQNQDQLINQLKDSEQQEQIEEILQNQEQLINLQKDSDQQEQIEEITNQPQPIICLNSQQSKHKQKYRRTISNVLKRELGINIPNNLQISKDMQNLTNNPLFQQVDKQKLDYENNQTDLLNGDMKQIINVDLKKLNLVNQINIKEVQVEQQDNQNLYRCEQIEDAKDMDNKQNSNIRRSSRLKKLPQILNCEEYNVNQLTKKQLKNDKLNKKQISCFQQNSQLEYQQSNNINQNITQSDKKQLGSNKLQDLQKNKKFFIDDCNSNDTYDQMCNSSQNSNQNQFNDKTQKKRKQNEETFIINPNDKSQYFDCYFNTYSSSDDIFSDQDSNQIQILQLKNNHSSKIIDTKEEKESSNEEESLCDDNSFLNLFNNQHTESEEIQELNYIVDKIKELGGENQQISSLNQQITQIQEESISNIDEIPFDMPDFSVMLSDEEEQVQENIVINRISINKKIDDLKIKFLQEDQVLKKHSCLDQQNYQQIELNEIRRLESRKQLLEQEIFKKQKVLIEQYKNQLTYFNQQLDNKCINQKSSLKILRNNMNNNNNIPPFRLVKYVQTSHPKQTDINLYYLPLEDKSNTRYDIIGFSCCNKINHSTNNYNVYLSHTFFDLTD